MHAILLEAVRFKLLYLFQLFCPYCENLMVYLETEIPSTMNNVHTSNNKWYVLSYVLHEKETSELCIIKYVAVVLRLSL
jgi:hypothetical protein